ncbi:hypothetical protein COD96_06990 [Bacillus thuringiensis]|nr:hypothetical protein AT261_18030 [Bacillus cereus]PEC18783.1 hypothetical protein CON19_00140 [Bacillus thuringiensis]PGV71826.1 hypothetical protein COD96_06990 [Bacillus thuringiensis]
MIDPNDERAQKFSKLGAPLIWPGQFLLGTHNGSFLVFRRLQQDVAAFNQFVENIAAEALTC